MMIEPKLDAKYQGKSNIYTKKCLKSLDCFSPEEAGQMLMESGGDNSDCVSNYLSAKDASGLVSVYDILRRNRKLSMYYQMFPNPSKALTDSQASALAMDEESQSKIIKIEVATLKLSNNVRK